MKKIFFLALFATFFISCSNDESVSNDIEETSVAELQDYDDLFAKFSNFTVDGKVTSDKTKIKELTQSAVLTNYDPAKQEVNFYTTNEKFEELTKISMADLENSVDPNPDKDVVDGYGLNFDSEGSSDIKLEGKEDANAKIYINGISGLNSLANNSTYTNFSKRVYFMVKYTYGTSYFIRAAGDDNIFSASTMLGVKMTSDVRAVNMHLGYSFRNLYEQSNVKLSVKNDMSSTRYVILFENINHTGKKIILTLSKDGVHNFSRYQFGSFSADHPRSIKVVQNL